MAKKLYSNKGLTQKQIEIRNLCMSDLRAFVGLVAPSRRLGHCHHNLLKFFMSEEDTHQIVLWPRAHQKSTMIAYWVCWCVINDPTVTILYASATSALAESQLTFIKNILDSEVVRKYWPELVNNDEGRRTMWRSDAFCIDHERRKAEAIRDPTVKAVGMGANTTGFHADKVVLDDIVVKENAETKTERNKVKSWYSLLSSVLNPGGQVKAVGTRYDPDDLYEDLITMVEELYDDAGDVIGEDPVYTYSIEVVEIDGEFFWPRQRRQDGKWFGFNRKELALKKAQYLDKAQFFAQYYNDPSDPKNKRIQNFEYYDRSDLKLFDGRWCISGNILNVYAAIDFAATISKKSDYTSIVVVGIDKFHRIYILDIDRFKTEKISVMHSSLTKLFDKWHWIKLRAETNAQQNLVVEQIKDFNRKAGIFYTIDKISQTMNKEIRIMSNLEPRYSEGMIVHYKGGNCQILEDELIATKPPHDDVSDALASVIEIIIAPIQRSMQNKVVNINYHPRYGGVAN